MRPKLKLAKRGYEVSADEADRRVKALMHAEWERMVEAAGPQWRQAYAERKALNSLYDGNAQK